MPEVEAPKDRLVLAAVLLTVTYNAILAIINGYVMRLGFAHVAMSEMAILAICMVVILKRGVREEDFSILLFLIFTLVVAIFVSAVNRMAYVDQFRNVLIIFCFAVLGTWASRHTVILAFTVATVLVMSALLLEVFSLTAYAGLFQPARYFEATRGLAKASYDDSGLFANALGFKGRLSFGIIGHRASSLFLEQVSLSNFAGVLMMFTLYFWPGLKGYARLLLVACIVFILLTTASRTMLTFAAVCVFFYFAAPRFPKGFNIVIMPAVLLAATAVAVMKPDATGDNFTGRIVLTMRHVSDMDFWGYFGLSAAEAANFADSGYVYLVYGGTIFGLVMFWLFITFYPANETPAQKRLSSALSVFIFLNLMIGATPIFTSKIAGLLWLLVGHAKFPNLERRQSLSRPLPIKELAL